MRIAVLTDIHANRPALLAVLADVRAQAPDAVFHTGDAIDLGPHPADVLDLLAQHNVKCVMGNHDQYLLQQKNSRRHRPPPGSHEEDGGPTHIEWTAAQLGPRHRHQVKLWPWLIEHTFSGKRLALLHYALADPDPAAPFPSDADGFADIPPHDTPETLDATFAPHNDNVDLIFHGHTHEPTDLKGKAHYLSAGPLGLYDRVAPYLLIDLQTPGHPYTVDRRQISYDDTDLAHDWKTLGIPERDVILSSFYDGRYL